MKLKTHSTGRAAVAAGVHRDTLLRWLRAGLVPEPSRDRNGWRCFSDAEVVAIAEFAHRESKGGERALGSRATSYADAFRSIDWDFIGAETNYLTHRLHPYPAKFIPQIPNALIQELSSVGDTVGDIFCGSGTTLVEATTLKRHAVGVDANPLACMIARTKTARLSEPGVAALERLVERSRAMATVLTNASTDSLFPQQTFRSKAWRPDFPKLEFWFGKQVIEELAEVLGWIQALPSGATADLARTAFSSIVVAVSNQDSDTRYVRRDKGIAPGDTCRRFAKALESAIRASVEYGHTAEERFRVHIREASLLDEPEIPELDLMVCSPPYPNAYSYHLYHMTRMIWLGMDQPRFKREEIGSHRKYSSPGRGAATVETFRTEFTTIMSWLAGRLKKGGFACFVVGNSTLKGQHVDNAELIASAGSAAGFVETLRIDRTMQASKKSFNPKIGRIKKEQIVVLRNERP